MLRHGGQKRITQAPVAQLDRALASGAKGREFESRQARQFLSGLKEIDVLSLDFNSQSSTNLSGTNLFATSMWLTFLAILLRRMFKTCS